MLFVDECDVYGGKLRTRDQTGYAVAAPRTALNWFFWEFHRPAFNICSPSKSKAGIKLNRSETRFISTKSFKIS
jgi:hypothetical protein